MRGLVVDLVLEEQRGVRGGRPAAEGARARIEGDRVCQQLTRRPRPRYVLSGTVCDQNLIAFRPSKCSQFRLSAPLRPDIPGPGTGGTGGGGGHRVGARRGTTTGRRYQRRDAGRGSGTDSGGR